ncbi:carbohydrate porin [Bradyrhizobium sp. CCBAU 53421]|uniref:carbohydrate porin n=1 Tax=Bradyrhizobium sp. CCBAU 53421 TaxID=1325120 RepID=UPI001FEDC352|nr:carbohydrate porin [Bradyrhizobium sp. CCBAU 53421]
MAHTKFRRAPDSCDRYQIREGWTLHSNFQYIIHPGGGATSPSSATPHNATVVGLRSTLKF